MKLRKMLPVLLAGTLLIGACAQATTPPPAPAETQASPTQPAESPVMPVDVPPTSAYPGPDEPINPPAATKPHPNPGYAPQPGDDQLNRGSVFVDESGILTMESYPSQFVLHLIGNLPTPCHQLRAVVSEPDKTGRINVELYSLSDPNALCTQVLAPFEATIPLGSYTEGSYPVTINGDQLVGEINP